MIAEAAHVVVDAPSWRALPEIVDSVPRDQEVLIAVRGASTCAVVAGLSDAWARSVGVWLELSDEMPASLAARDVATLSWLVDLSSVVVARPDGVAPKLGYLFAALLGGERTSVDVGVAHVHGAYNRPAPRRPVRVATSDDGVSDPVATLSALGPRPGVAAWDVTRSVRRDLS